MLTCDFFHVIVDDLASGRAMDGRTQDRAWNHMKECPLCAAFFEERRSLMAALKSLADASAGKEASPQLENVLRVCFRGQKKRAGWRARKRRWVAGAVAACALLGITSAIWKSVQRRHDATQSVHRAATNQAARNHQDAADYGEIASLPRRQELPSSTVETIEMQDAGEEGFIPLPQAEGAPPVADAQVVTVRLTASDLEEIGLPVPALALAGQQYVTADILIGEDGIARAIRIVE